MLLPFCMSDCPWNAYFVPIRERNINTLCFYIYSQILIRYFKILRLRPPSLSYAFHTISQGPPLPSYVYELDGDVFATEITGISSPWCINTNCPDPLLPPQWGSGAIHRVKIHIIGYTEATSINECFLETSCWKLLNETDLKKYAFLKKISKNAFF